jgi:hypothetical protein
LLASFAELEHPLAEALPMASPVLARRHRPPPVGPRWHAVFIIGSLHGFFDWWRGRTNKLLQQFANLS